MGRGKGDIWKVLSEYKAAFILVSVNVAVYLMICSGRISGLVLPFLVTSPANVINGRLYCIITSGFIHKDLTHLAFNMIGVFIFAGIVERHFGAVKTIFIYMGSLVISMFFSMAAYTFILHRNVGIIGASGALMGLVAAAMLIDPFRITYEMIIPLPVMLKAWFFVYADYRGLLGGKADGISHIAHLFGFISIAFLVYFMDKKERRLLKKGLAINLFTFILFLAVNQWLVIKTGRPFLNWLGLERGV
ncbi:MAG: rhomboid family intramembrane serine protease [Candidatus Omnitrophota bacterium]